MVFVLQDKGKKVLFIDFDIGMGNIDILMGNLLFVMIIDVLIDCKFLMQLLFIGLKGLWYIVGGIGLNVMFQLDQRIWVFFVNEFFYVLSQFDYVLFDMGVGLLKDQLFFILLVEDILIIIIFELMVIMDVYSVVKYLVLIENKFLMKVVVNWCCD